MAKITSKELEQEREINPLLISLAEKWKDRYDWKVIRKVYNKRPDLFKPGSIHHAISEIVHEIRTAKGRKRFVKQAA